LRFTLVRRGEFGHDFAPLPLPLDPALYTERLYRALGDLSEGADPTVSALTGATLTLPRADIDRRVKQFGQNLWRTLIPEDLKAVYAKEREGWRDESLLVVSDEPYFPWELVWPYAPGSWEDEAPWCIRMRFARWLRRDAEGNGHVGPPELIRVKRIACLAPTDSALKAAHEERRRVQQFIRERKLVDASPLSQTWGTTIDLLEKGRFDWLHLASHGSFHLASPDADSAVWLEGGRPLTPDAFVGAAIEEQIGQYRPAFFFNACEVAQQGWTLNRLGGWANRLLSQGASFFLAPLWSVTDSCALEFATTLYHELERGQRLAGAVREARLAARRAGDPTWLAYSLYGHPEAQVVFRP
jgi:hypothetical protein